MSHNDKMQNTIDSLTDHFEEKLSNNDYVYIYVFTSRSMPNNYSLTLAPNGPEKWGCRMRIRDLFSKIRDLFSKFRDLFTNMRLRDQKNSRCT